MHKKRFFENKKGISIMVSYVLLVVFLIIISGLVYQWLRTYVPRESLECPDGSSIFIKEAAFNPLDSQLSVTVKNNGRFNLAGYFIYATNDSEQELPIIDLSSYLNDTQGTGIILGNSVLFFAGESSLFSPGSEETYFFNIPTSIGELYSIRIVPTRFQEFEGKTRFVSCSNARTDILVSIATFFIAFATSQGGFDGNLGGLEGADLICNDLAEDAGLNGTFVAWLSINNINAIDRIEDEIYALPNTAGEPKTKVINNKEDIINGNLLFHPINITEFGGDASTSGGVWTGTDEFGNAMTNKNCEGWTVTSGYGIRGRSNAVNKDWTNYNEETCSDEARRLYCFEIE